MAKPPEQILAEMKRDLESKVAELKAMQAEVLERSTEITANRGAVKQADDELRARLGVLRDDVQRAVKRFELENQGVDAVRQRILDLRGGLTAMEGRFKLLQESSWAITEVNAKADGLMRQLEGIAENVAMLGTQAERAPAIEASTGRLGNAIDGMTQRVAQLEKAHPGVQAALEDVAMLRGTHESVRIALEQVEGAADEMARVLEQQAGTKAWLTGVTDQINKLRAELTAVEELKPTVESVRGEANRVAQAMGQIDARSKMVDDLNTRLSELTALGTQLDERSRELLTRMAGADERFAALTARADEAARIGKLLPAAVATVERAERRVGEVDDKVTTLESRAHNLEGLAERTRALGQELEQKQTALDKATEHLDRVAQLREQAATAAQQLEERSSQLGTAVTTAGNRLLELTATLDELDHRAGTLRFAQKRMAQFEERLAKWEAVESQLTRALEQISQRQATVDAMQADMHRLYEVAEKTTDEMRSIASAREEVGETRSMLETVLSMVTHVHDAANDLEHRKRQVEQAEERLVRADAMLAEVQAGLERLHGQKALLDQAVIQASALEFHTKQAEAVIAALRQERETSLSHLREERRA
jgi:DNA repair protein SbcC/Rad50